uniref:Uncharacterized protein n=1 Tax=Magallana gigas TaxID=29159 RepID=A0A8W8JEH1_MAGGI
MPKIKKQLENVLEHSNSASDNKSKLRYGFPYRKRSNFCCFRNSFQLFTSQPAEKPSFTEDIECSIKLFPHLIHVRDLTNDFIERAAGVIQIPKDQSFHELMKKDRIKVRRSDTLSSQSLLGSEAHGDSEREKIGECVFSSDLQDQHIPIFADVALVKIDDEVKERCNRTIFNDVFQQSKVYSDNLENLVNRAFVYKVGAQTRLTKGYILSPALYITGREETFLVSAFGDVHFAEPGDSGSVVFMNENSSALDTINVIGMFFGSCTLNEEDCKEKSACFRMGTALEFLNQNGWDISFENQI